MSKPKELHFFVDSSDDLTGAADAPPGEFVGPARGGNWSRGLDWYRSHFPEEAPIRGESSPSYADPWRPYVAERMASLIPRTKLILMVRDPIERTLSHYRARKAAGREWRSLDEALDPRGRYVSQSRYFSCLKPYLDRFSQEQLLVMGQEDLKHRRRQAMREVFAFLGVSSDYWSPKMLRERNPTNTKGGWRYELLRRVWRTPAKRVGLALPQDVKWYIERFTYRHPDAPLEVAVDDRLRQRLAAEFSDDADSLRALTGKSFDTWTV